MKSNTFLNEFWKKHCDA